MIKLILILAVSWTVFVLTLFLVTMPLHASTTLWDDTVQDVSNKTIDCASTTLGGTCQDTVPEAVRLDSFAGRGLEALAGGDAIHVKPDVYCANIPAQSGITNWFVFRAPEAMTVTGIDCIVDAGTSVVMTPQECDGNGGTCADIEAAITCAATNTIEAGGSVDNPSIDAGDYIRITMGTVTGAVNQAMMCLEIKFND